ncbi:MAG TPA: hypothetical protein VJN18_35860 [Polyangiaceae bacterium]|nr:hypothetical protein [Polyangiaceae bacterium]
MAAETNIQEFPFVEGQNEGVQRSVLGAPALSYAQNVRYRKRQRLGKRHGYTSVTSLDADGAALGNGNGRLACLGPEFCVVDDRFYQRDATSNAWQTPPEPYDNGAVAGTRLYGRFPQFLPCPVRDAFSVQSDLNLGLYTGTDQPSMGGLTYGLGHVWMCCSFFSDPAGAWLIRVTAIDPTSGRVAFRKDIDPVSTTPATVRQQPALLATGDGNTIVLIYDHFTAGVKDGVRVRCLTSITGGFGAEVPFACTESAANYDPATADGILFVYVDAGSPNDYTIARMNPTTMVASASTTHSTGTGKTHLSCFCNAAGQVWVGLTDATNGLRSHAYNSALVLQGTGINWTGVYTTAVGPILFTSRTSSTVCAVASSSSVNGRIFAFDVASSGGISGRMAQFNCKAISQPFTIGSQCFIWVRHLAPQQLGVASLVRIPLGNVGDEYANNAVSPYVRSWPLEATLDDWDIDVPVSIGSSGPVFPTPIATPLGYLALIDYTRDSLVAGGTTTLLRGFVLVPVRHRSEGVRYSASCVVTCAGKHFVAAAQPMWVDAQGAYEGGFVQAPVITATASGTGNLTSGIVYTYSAVYYSIDANGLIERSAPASPITVSTVGSGTTEQTISLSMLSLGMRVVRCELYRSTAESPSILQLVNSVDTSPASDVSETVTFVDGYADSDVAQNKTLYTQIGQELPASQFPACSFATQGGSRLLCAGGFNGKVGHFSKLFRPHICPEFADDDAFRVSLPADWTGATYCDNWVGFTREGIYIIAGDGPDDAGVGAFAPAARLPYNLGCVDWRSVVATDAGVFFQSARGLELLPRGNGQPQSMDWVQGTLEAYPIITAARAFYSGSAGEQTVQFCCVADEAATTGVIVTYDLTFKAWSVDTFGADYPATFLADWQGERVTAPGTMTVGPNGASHWHPFRVEDSGFDDNGLSVPMLVRTGDVRPWGTFGHGVINRVGLLGELRSACTLNLGKVTDKGTGHTAQRVYTAAGVGSEPAAGADIYFEAPLGNTEQRDVTALRVEVSETSTAEGVALVSMVLERDKSNQGFKILGLADRAN